MHPQENGASAGNTFDQFLSQHLERDLLRFLKKDVENRTAPPGEEPAGYSSVSVLPVVEK